jgi:hypothetical protein
MFGGFSISATTDEADNNIFQAKCQQGLHVKLRSGSINSILKKVFPDRRHKLVTAVIELPLLRQSIFVLVINVEMEFFEFIADIVVKVLP